MLEDKLGHRLPQCRCQAAATIRGFLRPAGRQDIRRFYFRAQSRADATGLSGWPAECSRRYDAGQASECASTRESQASESGASIPDQGSCEDLMGDRLYEKIWAFLNRKEPDSGDGGDNAE
jgi:hypothetical protein